MNNFDYVVAFDFGTRNIGIAIGQSVTCTAQPLTTLKNISGKPDWISIEKIFNEWKPSIVIVGYPIDMKGNEQLITIQTKQFVNLLKNKFNVHIVLQDERLTTVEARSKLFNLGGYRKLKKNFIDSGSAVLILEDWLLNYVHKRFYCNNINEL